MAKAVQIVFKVNGREDRFWDLTVETEEAAHKMANLLGTVVEGLKQGHSARVVPRGGVLAASNPLGVVKDGDGAAPPPDGDEQPADVGEQPADAGSDAATAPDASPDGSAINERRRPRR